MARTITAEEKLVAQDLLEGARRAMCIAYAYDQDKVDDLCRAVGWATANERTFVSLTEMAVAESGMGNTEGGQTRRFKIVGILRDALRQKSVGVIEELPEKGIVKYAKTASLGCGTWGGNITSENIGVKHFMNVTWVSRPIAEDKPTEHEVFGRFLNSEIL